MIRLSLLAGAAALALSLSASADTRTYSETGFTGISVSAGIDVSFTTGGDYAITAENRKGDFSARWANELASDSHSTRNHKPTHQGKSKRPSAKRCIAS